MDAVSRASLEKELALKDREISQLVADVHAAQAQLSDQRKVRSLSISGEQTR